VRRRSCVDIHDNYQVRTWTAWRRFVTLAMLALSFLMACDATAAASPPAPADPYHYARHHGPALTAAEIRCLFNVLIITPAHALLTTRSTL
jgi:hypothetical protein